MPIRLNLLAEAQAAAESRRRDPVKRAVWVAAFLIALVLAWSGYLQMKVMAAKSDLASVESQMSGRTNKYQQVMSNFEKADEIRTKIKALQEMTTNRFLNGNLMQALQRTTVDDVQLMRLRVEQAYAYTEGTKSKTNEDRVIPGIRAKTTEKILVTLEGTDTSARFDQYTRYQDGLIAYPYFKEMLVKTNGVTLKSGSLSMPQIAPSGKPTVSFTLECRFPDKTR